ncbi:MAG: CoA pyrophosphatase [Paracoccaceae bacterium]|nr:CoA pyrophosphatase [Paracoccaceae bacterium]
MAPDPRDVFHASLACQTTESSDFDLNPEVVLQPDRLLCHAAVLVVYQMVSGVPYLVLTKRSLALKHHPGQIAFPGGKRDISDQDITQTAQREAWEEIGLVPEAIKILGHLPPHETVTGFLVTPVLGWVKSAFEPIAEKGEVAEVFMVPLGHVTNRENYVVQSRLLQGQWRHYYTIPYGPYYIWGATASILRRIIV